jgi:hypothetical protein
MIKNVIDRSCYKFLRSIYEVRLKQFIVQNVLKIKTNISHSKQKCGFSLFLGGIERL